MRIAQQVRNRLDALKPGEVVHLVDFIDLPSKYAVRQHIHRMYKAGKLGMAFKGLYYCRAPNESGDGFKDTQPSIASIINALERRSRQRIQVHGTTALYYLKLSNEPPIREVYLTNLAARDEELCGRVIRFAHSKQLEIFKYPCFHPVGIALSAIFYLGRDRIDEKVVENIKKALNDEQFDQLKACNLPIWFEKKLNAYESEFC